MMKELEQMERVIEEKISLLTEQVPPKDVNFLFEQSGLEPFQILYLIIELEDECGLPISKVIAENDLSILSINNLSKALSTN